MAVWCVSWRREAVSVRWPCFLRLLAVLLLHARHAAANF